AIQIEGHMTSVSTTKPCGDLPNALEGAAATLTLTRPQGLNAISGPMRLQTAAAIPRFAREPGVYALIIRSATAGAFSAGGDLRELSQAAREAPERARQLLADDYRMIWLLECFSKPTISL